MGDRSEQTRRAILEAASREFRLRGFHNTGMRDIAAALDMAVGNLYYYFKNKQALLAFLQEQTLSRLSDRARAITALPLRADGRLYLLITHHIQCINRDSPGSVAHIEIEELEEGARSAMLARRRDYERYVHRLIGEGIGAGLFRPVDVKMASLAVLGAANFTTKWFQPEGRLSARSVGQHFAEILVRGLLLPEVALAPPSAEDLAILA